MTKLWKNVLVLWAIGMGIAMSAPALAVNAVGPYYAMPAWDQKLPSGTRFIVLTNWNSEAVLDRETGLVWEQSPSTIHQGWISQSRACMDTNTGGRTGWRLPTIQELLSLVDRSQFDPTLPSGHPFSNVQWNSSSASPIFYWSASTAANTGAMFTVNFYNGLRSAQFKDGGALYGWCVRGGSGVDPQ